MEIPAYRTLFLQVIAGLVVLAIGSVIGKVYADHKADVEVQEFQAKAENLIRHDRFEAVEELAKNLPERIRNDKRVEFELIKASVFDSALNQEVFGVSDRAKLKALRTNAEFLDQYEQSAETAALVGVLYSLLDNPEMAVQQFQVAKKRNSSYANTFNYWGYTLMSWQISDGADPWAVAAEKKLQEAARLSPDYVWPNMNLGELALARADNPTEADYEAADKYFEEAERVVPQEPNAYMNSATCLLNLGLLQREAGNPTRATEYFGQASAKFRKASEELGLDSAILHLNQGYLFEATGDTDKALKQYGEALLLKPKFLDACIYQANLLERLARHDEAKRSYTRCRNLQDELASQLRQRAADAPDPKAARRLGSLEQDLKNGLAQLNKRIHTLESGAPAK
jgi:tetratricopeptide (TPR) repeat protein